MKRVLFISVTNFEFEKEDAVRHLGEKFEGLSKKINPYILARGKPFHKRIWNAEFYLLPFGSFSWFFNFFLGLYLCLAKKIDIIICQSPLLEGVLGAALAKIFKKELIIEIHGDWEEAPFLSKKRKLEFLERKIMPFLAKVSFKNADKIRGISNFLIEKARGIAPNKPYFIFPTFTDLSLFLNEKDTSFKNFILFVGHLQKVKGIEYLIESFLKISKEFLEFKLVIIGDGPERNNLELGIRKYELGNKVELKGKLSLEETKNVMKDCYCLVLPSLSEGLGRVIMEAMALGKPVIASRVGGVLDLIEDGKNGYLIEPKNSQDLAQKLKILLSDKNLAIEMGKKGRDFIKEKFSNEKYVSNYIKMIGI